MVMRLGAAGDAEELLVLLHDQVRQAAGANGKRATKSAFKSWQQRNTGEKVKLSRVRT